MAAPDLQYDTLPQHVRDNISADQWDQIQHLIIQQGESIPDTTGYINLKNGQIQQLERGAPATGPLLAEHDLSGARGKNDSQFEGTPSGAHPAPHR